MWCEFVTFDCKCKDLTTGSPQPLQRSYLALRKDLFINLNCNLSKQIVTIMSEEISYLR